MMRRYPANEVLAFVIKAESLLGITIELTGMSGKTTLGHAQASLRFLPLSAT